MKYFMLILQGMADDRAHCPGGRTAMEVAQKPTMNILAARSFNGLVKNIPDECEPIAETSLLSVFGCDPKKYPHCGSALEAAASGQELSPEQTAFRVDLVSVSEDEAPYADRVMTDGAVSGASAAEISELIAALNKGIATKTKRFYAGNSGHGSLIWKKAPAECVFTPADKAAGKKLGDCLPQGGGSVKLLPLFEKSFNILSKHPVNQKRREKGLPPLNSLWLSAPGKKPELPAFCRIWETEASVISASDLVKGLAVCAGMHSVDVFGATGDTDTDYSGKATAAIEEFNTGAELVCVHLGVPEVCSRRGDFENKAASIEKADSEILAPVYEYLCGCGEDFKLMVISDAVFPTGGSGYSYGVSPFFIYNSLRPEVGYKPFTEANAAKGGFNLPDGSLLLRFFIRKQGVPHGENETEEPAAEEQKKPEEEANG